MKEGTLVKKIAVIGCTGAVGREMLSELEDWEGLTCEVAGFASPRSEGMSIPFRKGYLRVQAFRLEALKGFDVALMSAGGAFSKEWAQKIADQGTLVIDNSSAWRMNDGIPLIVPEVNGHLLKEVKGGIIANPNCSTIQLVVALKPLSDHFGLEQVIVSTYQSVSGTGQQGINELSEQVKAQFNMQEPQPKVYPQTIAFNIIPVIGAIDDAGYCLEEEKMVRETRKILALPDLFVLPTVARVPVFTCHSESVAVKLSRAVTRDEAKGVLLKSPGVVVDEEETPDQLPTPLNVVTRPEVFVSRFRLPLGSQSSPWLQFWNVADNLKKGAATNAVQILKQWNARENS